MGQIYSISALFDVAGSSSVFHVQILMSLDLQPRAQELHRHSAGCLEDSGRLVVVACGNRIGPSAG